MRKGMLIILLTSITMVMVILSAWLLLNHPLQGKEYHIYLKYSIKITFESPDSVSLYLPMPLKEGGKPSEVVGNIQKSKGNCSWQVTNTLKGVAFMVNATENVTLFGSFEIKRNSPVYEYDAALSMAENRTTDISEPYYIWIWQSPTSHRVTVNISFEKNMGSEGSSYTAGYTARETIDSQNISGWQKTKVKVEIVTT